MCNMKHTACMKYMKNLSFDIINLKIPHCYRSMSIRLTTSACFGIIWRELAKTDLWTCSERFHSGL